MFQTYFNPNNSLLIILQISLLFGFTPALHDRKTEHFKALTSNSHSSAIADHMTKTDHRIKWDYFDILATGQSDIHCKITEALLIRDLKPALNENIGSEKLLLY